MVGAEHHNIGLLVDQLQLIGPRSFPDFFKATAQTIYCVQLVVSAGKTKHKVAHRLHIGEDEAECLDDVCSKQQRPEHRALRHAKRHRRWGRFGTTSTHKLRPTGQVKPSAHGSENTFSRNKNVFREILFAVCVAGKQCFCF